METKRESLTKSLYSDSPKLGRDKEGKVAVNKGGKSSEKSTEADQITSGADGAMRDTTDRHAAERFSMHHEHIKERMGLHERHAHEHMRHKEGDKKEMHARHHEELKNMYKEHEKQHKAMMDRHDAELSGGTEGEGEEQQA
jgi:hypothetical protein